MQALLFESPLLLTFGGLLIIVGAAFVWTQNGSKPAAYVAVGAFALTVVLVLICQQVETDRESIRGRIDDAATALSRNDLNTIYSLIHPSATEGVQRAKAELPQFKFSEARVTRLKSIVVNASQRPPHAIAEFNVFVAVEMENQRFRIPRFVKVYFMKDGDRWLVRDYEHFEPSAGFRSNE